MSTIVLASISPLKRQVVARFFPEDGNTIIAIDCDVCKLPSQPIDCADRCAKVRLDYVRGIMLGKDYDYIIAIENGIDIVNQKSMEVCHVLIEHKGLLVHGSDGGYFVPEKAFEKLLTHQEVNLKCFGIGGYDTTIADIMHAQDPSVDPKNWIKSYYGVCRTSQIEWSIRQALRKLKRSKLIAESLINIAPNQNALLRDDISGLMSLLSKRCQYDVIDYIASQSSVGFGLSCKLSKGYIPIVSAGYLSSDHKPVYQNYSGSQQLMIPIDIKGESRVIIYDDLITDGKRQRAICDAFQELNVIIVDYIALRETPDLRKQAQETIGRPYTVLLQ